MRLLTNLLNGTAAMRSPEDESGQPAAAQPSQNSGEPGPIEAEEETSRKKIADRDWIDGDGKPVEEEKAVAARYTFLGDGKSASFAPVTDDAATRMLAIFGALTLFGNVTNTWKGEKGDKAASPVDAIAERLELLGKGEWIDRTASPVGARVDKDALVAAYVEYAAEQGITKDPVAVLEKITDKPQLIKDLRSIPEVLAKYTARVGKGGKSAADVMASV